MHRWTKTLSRAEWLRLSGFGGAVLMLHLLGWGLFLGLHALYAYELVPWSTLDWEHRTVRKLIEQKRRG